MDENWAGSDDCDISGTIFAPKTHAKIKVLAT